MIERISNRIRRLNATWYPQRVFQSPRWLVLGVNNTCNLHCKMCDVGVENTRSNFYENLMGTTPIHMPIDLFKKVIDEAALYFPKVKIGYAFTEPLIYSHLEESLMYCRSRKVFTSITTNALGLKRWAPVLIESRLSELNISLDGPSAVHNFIRGNPHSFSKAIEGIEALSQLGCQFPVNIYCVITEWNAGKLMDFLRSLSPFDINRVGFMHANFTTQDIADAHNAVYGFSYPATSSNVTDTNSESLDIDALWTEMQQIGKVNWRFKVEFFPSMDSKQDVDRYYKNPDEFIGRRCMDIFSNMMIKSNGDVIPAHGRCFNLRIGNLYEQNLKEIWNSGIISEFRKTVSRNGGLLPACSRCCSSFVK